MTIWRSILSVRPWASACVRVYPADRILPTDKFLPSAGAVKIVSAQTRPCPCEHGLASVQMHSRLYKRNRVCADVAWCLRRCLYDCADAGWRLHRCAYVCADMPLRPSKHRRVRADIGCPPPTSHPCPPSSRPRSSCIDALMRPSRWIDVSVQMGWCIRVDAWNLLFYFILFYLFLGSCLLEKWRKK